MHEESMQNLKQSLKMSRQEVSSLQRVADATVTAGIKAVKTGELVGTGSR